MARPTIGHMEKLRRLGRYWISDYSAQDRVGAQAPGRLHRTDGPLRLRLRRLQKNCQVDERTGLDARIALPEGLEQHA